MFGVILARTPPCGGCAVALGRYAVLFSTASRPFRLSALQNACVCPWAQHEKRTSTTGVGVLVFVTTQLLCISVVTHCKLLSYRKNGNHLGSHSNLLFTFTDHLYVLVFPLLLESCFLQILGIDLLGRFCQYPRMALLHHHLGLYHRNKSMVLQPFFRLCVD